MMGEFERDDVSVKILRLRGLLFGFVVVGRRLTTVVTVVAFVTVDEEEASSGSGGTTDDGDEVAEFFDESSVSFSFQMRRDTAQR